MQIQKLSVKHDNSVKTSLQVAYGRHVTLARQSMSLECTGHNASVYFVDASMSGQHVLLFDITFKHSFVLIIYYKWTYIIN